MPRPATSHDLEGDDCQTSTSPSLHGLGELEPALVASGAGAGDAAAAAAATRKAFRGGPGDLRLESWLCGGALRDLRLRTVSGAGVEVSRAAHSWSAAALASDLKAVVRVRPGQLSDDTFYAAAVQAGVHDSLIDDFANAFAFDFDFQRDVSPGDRFEAVFEETVNGAGQAVGARRLLFVSLRTAAKSRDLYRFTPPGAAAGWFDGDGRSTARALMRTPVDGARISSRFGWRLHPILGFQKLHKGIDFAAPTGTPVYAAGDGLVEYAAPKGPNGNFVSIRQDNNWRTLYLHLNRFAPGLAAGQRVRQGQQIGEIGTTGRSTGPHLHYEVHIEGQPVDPATIPVGQGQRLTGAAMQAFVRARDQIDAQRRAQGA